MQKKWGGFIRTHFSDFSSDARFSPQAAQASLAQRDLIHPLLVETLGVDLVDQLLQLYFHKAISFSMVLSAAKLGFVICSDCTIVPGRFQA